MAEAVQAAFRDWEIDYLLDRDGRNGESDELSDSVTTSNVVSLYWI